jgi:sulfur carrier protein ThiS adenylyltransferase
MTSLFSKNVPETINILQNSKIGIAGCGGLGSNVATMLTRAGIGELMLVDFDNVEMSNLNRQHFFLSDVGKTKVEALSYHLKNINPDIKLNAVCKKLVKEDVESLFKNIDILIEAFDKAEAKKWLIKEWLKTFKNKPIICGSGISGYGKSEKIQIQSHGNLFMVGDQISDPSEGLCSPRINIVAARQANLAIEILMNFKKKKIANDNS